MKKIWIFVLALVGSACIAYGAEKEVQTNNEERTFVMNHSSVTPVRKDPSERSEQETQLLFGEVCEVMERKSGWTKIRSIKDGQEGWVTTKMVTVIDDATREVLTNKENLDGWAVVATPMSVITAVETGEKKMLTIGTQVPGYADGMFELLGQQYRIDPQSVLLLKDIAALDKKGKCELIMRIAHSLLNVPYLWGGKNMMGYDCSGFTQVVYSVMGITILRNAREQFTQGEEVKTLAEAQPGDLVFFDHADRNPEATRITHVGMLISSTELIHCASCVHVDKIDETGIRLPDGSRSHHLVKIKRFF